MLLEVMVGENFPSKYVYKIGAALVAFVERSPSHLPTVQKLFLDLLEKPQLVIDVVSYS